MPTVLEEAESLVNGDRQQEYGPPEDNLNRIAQVWGGILGVTVTAQEVCLCMAGLKLARAGHKPGRDSLVDAAGYVRLVEMIS